MIFEKIIEAIIGTKSERALKTINPIVAQINALEEQFSKLTDDELKAKTPEFKERLAKGETLDDLLPEAFATVREAGKRVLHMRHYDVQLIGGIVLHKGKIAEMRTGEGKTLVSTLPAYLNALTGKGVHIVTVNDYLAKRDSEWMGPLHRFLGLTVGSVQHDMRSGLSADCLCGGFHGVPFLLRTVRREQRPLSAQPRQRECRREQCPFHGLPCLSQW